MNRQLIASICSQVYRRYPQVNGASPKIEDRPNDQVLLIFRGSSKAADGRTLSHTVRVVASADGKIIKMTSSK